MSTASASALQLGLDLAHWSVVDLWRATLGIGGSFTTEDVARLMHGDQQSTPVEHDILASALNDQLLGLGAVRSVPFWAQLPAA